MSTVRSVSRDDFGRPLQVGIVIGVGVLFCVLALGEVRYVNGSEYWSWMWRRLPLVKTAALFALPLIPLAYVVAVLDRVERTQVRVLLFLLVVSNLAFKLASILAEPQSFGFIPAIITAKTTTGFYTDAVAIQNVREWMAGFHQLSLHLHTVTHPAGPVLLYRAWIDLLGEGGAPYGAAAFLGLFSSLGVLAMYAFAGVWTEDLRTRLLACVWYALSPGFILFFPGTDQGYVVIAMLMVVSWVWAAEIHPYYGVAFGAVVAVATLFAYNLLTIGAFLGLYSACQVLDKPDSRQRFRRAVQAAVAAGVTFVGIYVVLDLWTGYRPVLAFQRAVAVQHTLDELLHRGYYPAVLLNIYDFFLGAGVIVVPLLLIYLGQNLQGWERPSRELMLSVCGLLAIAIIDITGLLSFETARLWLFLQPFLIVPAALQLRTMRLRDWTYVLLTQWCVLVVLKAKFGFLLP